MALHTWGRNLSHHPHIHCLVTAGGLSPDGRWLASRDPRLLPFPPLRQLLRGKFLGLLNAMLRDRQLQLPAPHDTRHWFGITRLLYRKHWALEILPAYPHGKGVALYLAHYAKGGPIPKDRPLHLLGQQVRMTYTSHRDHARHTLQLSAQEFIARVLWHAPPQGLHTTRYAGLYCSAHAALRRSASEQLLASPAPQAWPRPAAQPNPAASTSVAQPQRCPLCSAPLLRLVDQPVRRHSEFSLYPHVPPPTPPPISAVQPLVQADALRRAA